MRFNPLTGRIQPSFLLAADAGGDGGTAVAEPPPAAPQPSFADLMTKGLRENDAAERQPTPEEKPPEVKPTEQKAPEQKAPEPKVEPKKKPLIPGMPDDVLQPEKQKVEGDLDTAEMKRNLSSKGRENFERLESSYRGKLEAKDAELATFKSRLAELEAENSNSLKGEEAKALKAELDAIKAEHAKLLGTVEQIGVERHPEFQAKYVAGRAKLVEEAVKRVIKAGGNVEEFRRALQVDGAERYRAIENALDGTPAFVTSQVADYVTRIENLDEEREQTIAKGRDNLGRWAEQETAKQREEAQKISAAREQLFDKRLEDLQKEVIFLRRNPGNDEDATTWNKKVDGIIENSKNLLLRGTGNFDDFAAAAVKAQAYDIAQAALLDLGKKYMDLQEQLAAMTAAEPGGSTGAGGGNGGAPAEENLSFAQQVQRGLEMGQRAA